MSAREGTRRRTGGRVSPFVAGAIAISLLAFGIYVAFAGGLPFTGKGFELKAVVRDSSALGPRSPVRIAGVEVGKVRKVEPLEDAARGAVVTMQIEDQGLPVHRDATLEVRPRIFLEGNVFVDLRPGTPAAGELEPGGTLPVTQTAGPVQLGEVLDVLTTDTRTNARALVRNLGAALSGPPTPDEDADQDPAARGETAAESLNDSIDDAPGALRGQAIVADALLGSEPRDLSRLVDGAGRLADALVANERDLQDLLTNFNRTTAALAARQGDLRATVRLLPEVLDEALPALGRLNTTFPPTRAFAREAIPALRESPATIDAALPWIEQVRALVSPRELGGLVRELRPAVRDLATVTERSVRLLPEIDLIDRCLLEVVLPTGDVVIEDPPLTTGLPNYKEFWVALVGLAGESQNFDGNGLYVRFHPGGGSNMVSAGDAGGSGQLYANAPTQPLGARPKRPARKPPYRPDVPCHSQQIPALNEAETGPGP